MRMLRPREIHKRTTCACAHCVEFCECKPGSLVPEDIKRIEDHLGETIAGSTMFELSLGTVVVVKDAITIVPMIVPKRKENGSCVFLSEDKKCMIHEVAPYGCSHFDAHMGFEEGERRSRDGIIEVCRDIKRRGRYFDILNPWMEEAFNAGQVKEEQR